MGLTTIIFCDTFPNLRNDFVSFTIIRPGMLRSVDRRENGSVDKGQIRCNNTACLPMVLLSIFICQLYVIEKASANVTGVSQWLLIYTRRYTMVPKQENLLIKVFVLSSFVLRKISWTAGH